MENDSKIREVHKEFERLTGQTLALTLPRMDAYDLWMAKGFTVDDLRVVVCERLHVAKQMGRPPSLRWSSLIENLDRFEEELQNIRQAARHKVSFSHKALTLAASGRPNPDVRQPSARTPAQIMAGERAFEELKKLRLSL